MTDNIWVLVFGGIFAFLNAFAVGTRCSQMQYFGLLYRDAQRDTGLLPASNSSQCVAGANMPANCWGAIIGAKVVKYRTAVLLGIVCELVGSLVFDPRVAAVYNGVLKDWTVLKPFPGLTLYALMWAQITPTVMQLLAIRKQILVPPFLGFGTVPTSCARLLAQQAPVHVHTALILQASKRALSLTCSG